MYEKRQSFEHDTIVNLVKNHQRKKTKSTIYRREQQKNQQHYVFKSLYFDIPKGPISAVISRWM